MINIQEELTSFDKKTHDCINNLFDTARQSDEAAFVFSLLGITALGENHGWDPFNETLQLTQDLTLLINTPLHPHTKARLLLLLYCHITEASFIYHIIYNLLLTIEKEPPRVFNFLKLYKNGAPPSVIKKIKEIRNLALKSSPNINIIFDEIIRSDIRNAFFHSDYILFENELRLKHRGSEIKIIYLEEINLLINKAINFMHILLKILKKNKQTFPDGYIIKHRKSKDGRHLSNIKLIIEEQELVGISSDDPLPTW